MSLSSLNSSHKMFISLHSYMSSIFLSIEVTFEMLSKQLKNLKLFITSIFQEHTLLQCESLSMKINFNNDITLLEIFLKKFKQFIQKDLSFSSNLKIEYR